ncbi:MAG: RDD family protein [Puniceicoccales bacterium]|jgi:uncharacterized RDD family membrane protein YckC|nr:RDD family protein [Puniceicoccales bacterium]
MQYAHPLKRLAAWLIDALLLTLVGKALQLSLRPLFPPQGIAGERSYYHLVLLGTIVLISFLYFMLMNGSRRYRGTIGKMALGISVVNHGGHHIGFSQAIVRTLAGILSIIPLGAGFIMIAYNPQRRALHDLISDSWVINKPYYF